MPVLVSLVVLGVAALLAPWVSPRRRGLLAAGVLAVPVALALPGVLADEARETRASWGRSAQRAEIAAPLATTFRPWRVDSPEYRILALAVREIPEHAEIGLERPFDGHWARATAFAAAPRLVVPDLDAEWLILREADPDELGIEPRRSWRAGRYWLVQQ